ncbi:DUF1272 domain-containing protein [Streptomyces sp. NPDC059506]|uniref:DUF1272 domain-containing protein n=1 Tax=Streptomyces thermolineatus TaxID=44033 RepID=A0ABP5YCH6_9ACTN|nr:MULTISPECIES: DUF1272 domain-containing protein [unclassified Streptomyces]MCZ2528123.1 DUF1272 domain-containing protein [Streptomyces sp. HB2AG]PLW72069.1 DUF1272 domain-containing protein [Streptomyces sp. DJ]QMV24032.1 DUF1272 domain-containing protein [Streptomyces sp. SCUT-3]
MALEMRDHCEACDVVLTMEGPAWICSYECTFCAPCAAACDDVCRNCGGELVRRPRRAEPAVG